MDVDVRCRTKLRKEEDHKWDSLIVDMTQILSEWDENMDDEGMKTWMKMMECRWWKDDGTMKRRQDNARTDDDADDVKTNTMRINWWVHSVVRTGAARTSVMSVIKMDEEPANWSERNGNGGWVEPRRRCMKMQIFWGFTKMGEKFLAPQNKVWITDDDIQGRNKEKWLAQKLGPITCSNPRRSTMTDESLGEQVMDMESGTAIG